MSLKEKIQEDLKKSLKERKTIEVSTLRMLNAAIFNREKEKRYKLAQEKPDFKEKDLEKKSQLADEELIQVIFSEVKKRKEAIEEFEKGKRMDLAEKEKKEMEVLKNYLPEQISEEKIKKIAKEIIKEVGAESLKDLGKVMSKLMPKLKGKADGSLVSKIVKELLSPQK